MNEDFEFYEDLALFGNVFENKKIDGGISVINKGCNVVISSFIHKHADKVRLFVSVGDTMTKRFIDMDFDDYECARDKASFPYAVLSRFGMYTDSLEEKTTPIGYNLH